MKKWVLANKILTGNPAMDQEEIGNNSSCFVAMETIEKQQLNWLLGSKIDLLLLLL